MGELKRGDVILVRFPFTDFRTTKLRPAVVLAVHGEDVIVVGIFSQPPTSLRDTWLLVDEGDAAFASTGLKRASVIKAEKIALVHRSIVHGAIGSLSPRLLDALSQRVKRALLLS